MVEMKIIAGKHKCGRELDMRITPAEDDNKEAVAWIIYGICKKCKLVLISNLHLQPEKPVLNRDFIVDYSKIAKEVKSDWRNSL